MPDILPDDNVSPITVQVVRIREIFKTLQSDFGIDDLKIVPDVEMSFLEAFKSIADNLEEVISWLDELPQESE